MGKKKPFKERLISGSDNPYNLKPGENPKRKPAKKGVVRKVADKLTGKPEDKPSEDKPSEDKK